VDIRQLRYALALAEHRQVVAKTWTAARAALKDQLA
jgi:hypothetical protein